VNKWLSDNPDKEWVEAFFLMYSPVWMALMGLMMVTGWAESASNGMLLLHATIVALPIVLIPALIHRQRSTAPWYESYWFKANVYLFVFGFFGNYFGSEYFFDLLGMVYNYPNASSNLDSALLGTGEQRVPLIMYFYTHAYFMTYHATAGIALRKVQRLHVPGKRLLFPVMVFVVGYLWAWAETKAMANPMLAQSFYYKDMARMLTYGSAIYATYFIASFPIYYLIDEHKKQSWSLPVVIAAGLSASMLTFYMLDFITHWLGRL
jgi:cycloeucalenol cycloisomerase